jgi:hypothetical protein
MRHEIDPVLDCFIGGLELPNVAREEDDAILSLVEQGSLAAVIGHSAVAKFSGEIADIDAHVRKNRTAPPARSEDTPLVDDAHRLEKVWAGIRKGKKASRIEKSANGRWVMEYDENDSLIRGYEIEEDAA